MVREATLAEERRAARLDLRFASWTIAFYATIFVAYGGLICVHTGERRETARNARRLGVRH